MSKRLSCLLYFLLIQIGSFWPIGRWFIARINNNPSEQLWCLLALGTALFFFVKSFSSTDNGQSNMESKELIPSTLLTLLYVGTYPLAPFLLRASLALTAVVSTLRLFQNRNPENTGSWGLLLLSLPIIPTLQFYLGYPLRVLVGSLAVPLIRLAGFAVTREGACLNWGGELVWIDAPCSGIKMLWAGLYLTFTLACIYHLDFKKTTALTGLAILGIILGNTFRSAALFFTESRILVVPTWVHEATGVVVFASVAILISFIVHQIQTKRETSCGLSLSI